MCPELVFLAMQANSPEWFLTQQCGIPKDKVDAVMNTATAWRVTPAGRPLIDRRRRSRVARNVVLIREYLESLGIPAGPETSSLPKVANERRDASCTSC